MKDTMLAAVFEGEGTLSVKEMPMPRVTGPDDVKIKVLAGSICGSDIHVLSVPPGQTGRPGTIMGHEFYGSVEEVGSGVTRLAPGDRVVVDPIITCGHCEDCRHGRPILCGDALNVGQWSHGGFAQYALVPQRQVYKLPPAIPSYIAAQSEPLACVLNAMGKLNPTPADRVVIFGAGAIGLIFVRLMKLYGVRDVVLCETLETRRTHALRVEADHVLDPAGGGLEKALARIWRGAKATIAVDAVGVGAVTEQALPLLARRGRLLIFGQDARARATIPPALIVRDELQILGSYCSNNTFITAVELLENPKLGLELLVSHKVELRDIHRGIDAVASKEASRVIVYPNGMIDD